MMGAVQRQAYEKSRQMYQYIEDNCSCTIYLLVMEDAQFRMHASLLPGFSSMGFDDGTNRQANHCNHDKVE